MRTGRSLSGFTLIELMIVVAIIAIIAAIAIPSLLNARRNSNRAAVIQTLNSFYKAATDFSLASEGNYCWESRTAAFGEYFVHSVVKFGYQFKYLSDDTDFDGTDLGTRFIYLAYPVSSSTGRQSFYTTEDKVIYANDTVDAATLAALDALDETGLNFSLPFDQRITNPALVWTPAK